MCLRFACRITQLRWETGPVVPQELQQSLSARELELFNTYDRILTNFTQVTLATSYQYLVELLTVTVYYVEG